MATPHHQRREGGKGLCFYINRNPRRQKTSHSKKTAPKYSIYIKYACVCCLPSPSRMACDELKSPPYRSAAAYCVCCGALHIEYYICTRSAETRKTAHARKRLGQPQTFYDTRVRVSLWIGGAVLALRAPAFAIKFDPSRRCRRATSNQTSKQEARAKKTSRRRSETRTATARRFSYGIYTT